MKKFILVTMFALLCFTLSACFQVDNHKEEYPGDYHDWYLEGYSDGYYEGQEDLGSYADYCFDEICWDRDIEYALAILILHTEGEHFTEEEIEDAIWAVEYFYEDVLDMVTDIENYYH
jgi:hypothetical protein